MLQKGVKKMVFDKYFYKRDNILKRRIEKDKQREKKCMINFLTTYHQKNQKDY